MQFRNFTNYKYARLHYISTREGLLISKPVDETATMKEFPDLKVLAIEFGRTAFKKDFDADSFINKLLASIKLELLAIERGNNLTHVPEGMLRQPLKYLDFHGDGVKDFNALSNITSLEELRLSFTDGRIGKDLGKLKNLKRLGIYAQHVEDLEQIGSLPNLEALELQIKDLYTLPDSFRNLTRLKELEIRVSPLRTIPADFFFPSLEQLDLSSTNLDQLHAPLLETKYLKHINISRHEPGAAQFPSSLYLPLVEKLYLSSFHVTQFPEITAPLLKELDVHDMNVPRVCSQFKESVHVEKLWLSKLSLQQDDISYFPSKKIQQYRGQVFASSDTMNFSQWPDLQQCLLDGTDGVSFEIIHNTQLKSLTIRNNTAMRELTVVPEKLEELNVENCSELRRFSLQKAESLKFLNINAAPVLSQVIIEGNALPMLSRVTIENCPALQRLPYELLRAPQLGSVISRKNGPSSMDEEVDSVPNLLEYCQKNEVTSGEMDAVGFWLFNIIRFELPTAEMRANSIRLLRFSNDLLFKLISKHYHELNPERKKLEDFTLAELEEKKVAIAGNTFEAKTAVKESLKNSKMKMVTNVDEADFLLLAKKHELQTVNERTILFSESDLHHYLDKHQPKFLKQETVTEVHLTNLRQIMWSTSPETELMALEMMKNGGLPDEVLGECIAIAKTSEDKTVRAKYKNFLKGKISEEAFSLVSKNVRFDPKHNDPFHSLAYHYSTELLGKLAMALYQRIKSFGSAALNYHRTDFDLRMNLVADMLGKQVEERPHYISIYQYLTTQELAFLLSLPPVKGQLKRLHIKVESAELPEVLGEHTTLKELFISGNLAAASIPEVIFKLKRVSDLAIHSETLEMVDERIAELKELKTFNIYNKILIQLPESIRQLPKLSRLYCSQGIAEPERWREFMKSLR